MPEYEAARNSLVRGYLDTVSDQIRWKRARTVAVRELEAHLEDQRQEFQAEGHSPEEAERLAVEEMGDPVAVGTDLDRLHRPKSQWKMLCLLAAALGLWLVLRLAERWGVSYWSEYVVSFGGIVLLAAGLAAGIYLLDYTLLAKAALPLAVLLTAAAALGGRLQFQLGCTHDLGQYIILLLPVAMALAVYGLRSRGTGGLALCCVLGLLPAVCYLPGSPLRFLWALWGAPPVLWVSLFGVTGVLAAGVRLGAFGARRRNWLLVAAYILVVLLCLAYSLPHFWWWNEIQNPDSWLRSSEMAYARDVVDNARLVGMANAFPETQERLLLFWEKKISAHNGLMLTVLGNFGWLAFGLIQVPTVVLLGFGWKKCIHQKSALGRLVGIAVMLTLTWQTLAVVVQDLIGLDSFLILFPYPFLNDGGMALLLDCALLGERGWSYLLEQEASPLRQGGCALVFARVNLLDEAGLSRLLSAVSAFAARRRGLVLFLASGGTLEALAPNFRRVIDALGCLTLRMPPLRDHLQDVPSLAGLYISSLNMRTARAIVGFEPEAARKMQQYPWPGNYDQFRRVLDELVLMTSSAYIPAASVDALLERERTLYPGADGPKTPAAAPDGGPALPGAIALDQTLEQIELQVVKMVLAEEKGNQKRTAQRLGISRTTLWRMLQKDPQPDP